MGRVLLAGALLVAAVSVASAGNRKVTVETDPPGAKVYLNDKESGAVCDATPCTIEAPIGDTPIIVELPHYEAVLDNLVVSRRGRPPIVKFKLDKSPGGTIVVDGAPGATIKVDDEDQGKSPNRIDVDEGQHHVVISLGGKAIVDKTVDVEAGGETAVTAKAPAVAIRPEPATPAGPDPTETLDGGGGIVKHAPEKASTSRYINVSAMGDVGFRTFAYSGASGNNVRDESEGGQVLVGPAVELWPGDLLGVHALHGLSLFARLEFGVHDQDVVPKTTGVFGGKVTTFWRSFEASVRQRFAIGSSGAVEASVGFVRDQYEFNATDSNDVGLVPDVDYQALRIGVRGALTLGSVEPYLSVEDRIVFSGGEVGERFAHSSVNGMRGAIGAAIHSGPIAARIEASYTRYTWDFQVTDPMPMYTATGATDSVALISATLGYQY